MSGIKQGDGSHILAQRHETTLGTQTLPDIHDVLVIEDNEIDSDRLLATLRLLLGRDLKLRSAETLASALDSVLAAQPDVVFLDDYLKPNDTALETIPFLRRAGYEGHIVVVSGELDRKRRLKLIQAGASEAIHKDEVDSAKVAAALVSAYKSAN